MSYLETLLADAEAEQLSHLMPPLFGYHLLCIGKVKCESVLAEQTVLNRWFLTDHYAPDTSGSQIVGTADALPLRSDSVDAVCLMRVLERASDPHAILREIDRILIPEGHLIISGYNRWSFWGLARLLRGRQWQGTYISPNRVKDWLALLGFDLIVKRSYFFRPLINHRHILKRLALLEKIGAHCWPMLGSCYVLVAKKRVSRLTPIRPSWTMPKQRLPIRVVKPAVRGVARRE